MTDATVLVVEDNPDDEALILRALKKVTQAENIVVARDGAEALDYMLGRGLYALRDLTKQPRLVLLDLNLPTMTGLAVLQAIRANKPTQHVPVVNFTSSRDQSDVLDCLLKGANSYVCKPVDHEQFSAVVEHLGKYWLSINEWLPQGN